jgi:transcriptional regulator with XRE-family HTH domain
MARRSIGYYSHLDTSSDNRTSADEAVYAEFARRLQGRMVAKGWNQSELARRATDCLPKPTDGQVQGHALGRDRISSYLRGKYLPRPDGLAALCKALKCDPSDLLPAGAVELPSLKTSTMEMKWVGGNRFAINCVTSHETAVAIMKLLAQEA